METKSGICVCNTHVPINGTLTCETHFAGFVGTNVCTPRLGVAVVMCRCVMMVTMMMWTVLPCARGHCSGGNWRGLGGT